MLVDGAGRFMSQRRFPRMTLMISEASLADLNARLEQPVPMNRFRPDLIVSG
jgi:uncharacterized protein YcbX